MRTSLRKLQVFGKSESCPSPTSSPIDMQEFTEELNTLLCIVELQSIETEGIDMSLLIARLQSMLGLHMKKAVLTKVTNGELLQPEDIDELYPRVRYASTVPFSEGVALYQQAQGKQGQEADSLLKVAEEKFARAVQSQPDGHMIFTHWGMLLVERAKLASEPIHQDRLLEGAIEKFSEAVSLRRNNHYALSHWAEALQLWATMRERGGDTSGAIKLRQQAEQKFRESDLFGKRWFFGTLPTNGLQGLLALRGRCPDNARGVFFVRSSYSRPGHFVFSVITKDQKDGGGKDKVRNILIQESNDGRYALATEPTIIFDSLEDLIAAKTHEGYQPILRDWTSDS